MPVIVSNFNYFYHRESDADCMQRLIGELQNESGDEKHPTAVAAGEVDEDEEVPGDEATSRRWSALAESELLLPGDVVEKTETVGVTNIDSVWAESRRQVYMNDDDPCDDDDDVHNRVGVMANHLQTLSRL